MGAVGTASNAKPPVQRYGRVSGQGYVGKHKELCHPPLLKDDSPGRVLSAEESAICFKTSLEDIFVSGLCMVIVPIIHLHSFVVKNELTLALVNVFIASIYCAVDMGTSPPSGIELQLHTIVCQSGMSFRFQYHQPLR